MLGNPLKALFCVGVAYMLIGVLVPVLGLGGISGFNSGGSIWSAIGGAGLPPSTWPRSPPPASCSTACSTPYAMDAYAAWDTPARHDTRADHPGGCAALLCLGASPRPLT